MTDPLRWTRPRAGRYTCYARGYIIERLRFYKAPWLLEIYEPGCGGPPLSKRVFATLAGAKEAAQSHADAPPPA